MEALASNETGKLEKIKTHFARIVVGGKVEKPCYGILYFDPTDGKYHQGFGSYVLEYVFNWLAEEFEIVGDAFSNEPDRHGEWIDDRTDIVCSVCKTAFSDEITFMKRAIDNEYPKRCPECGAKMDGGAEE